MCKLSNGDLCDMQSTLFWQQKINKLFKIWTAQRGAWNKSDKSDDSDQTALPQHYTVFHGILL